MRKIEFTMERLRNLALGMIVALNAVATVTSFGESYFGLYRWATEHGVTGFWGAVWPMMVDLIILVAEAGLFVAHYDKWMARHKAWLWTVMFTALGVSVGGNTGHVHSTDYLSHLTAALPPVALMFTMTVGFGVMKRTFLNKPPITPRPGVKLSVAELVEQSNRLEEALTPASQPLSETPSPALIETPSQPLSESESLEAESRADAVAASTTAGLTDTLLSLGFKTTEKSYSQPPDPRRELKLPEKRVRDMYDVDPDISANAIAKALDIAWATADKYLKATKEARGVA